MKFFTTSLLAVMTVASVAGAAIAKETTVKMDKMKFVPDTITVAKGDTVTWVNADTTKQPHNVVGKTGAFKSKPVMMPGDKYSWKADKAGTFEYTCTFHPGMNGKVIVK